MGHFSPYAAPLLATVFVLGVMAFVRAVPSSSPESLDATSLVGLQTPWRSEYVLSLSDCAACSIHALDTTKIADRIGARTTLVAPNGVLSASVRRRFRMVLSSAPASEFGIRMRQIAPRLLTLSSAGMVVADDRGAQPIGLALEGMR